MLKSVKMIACSLALTMGAGGLASAMTAPAIAPASDIKLVAENGEKRLQRRHHPRRHGYRDRRTSRDHHDYRRGHRNDYRNARRHASRCWSENQRSHYRGRPAVVSVRVCRDRHGRTHAVRGSTRLVRYLRGHRRHW
ncbi:hypothetical protein AWH62_07650 [Maricaulis sp. W15]|uniref:hypothetical protein n=1 Tax=Maricaulis sp. W15 TaxID=1772333 RepID=UPI000948C5E1|nr:hypothetical protein [Maricaulis sp. W15]OLF74011.1 hypothetical protein AWH62_07650 [Maricaulis sp. W15]